MIRASPVHVAMVLLVGCESGEGESSDARADDPDFVTEHAEVYFDSAYPVCAGTLRQIDRQLERLSAQLDLPIVRPVELTIGLRAVEDACPPMARGCAAHPRGNVYTSITAMWHEMTHALRIQNELLGPPMFEEGLAEFGVASEGFVVMVGTPNFPFATADGPLQLLPIPRPEFGASSYPPATHVVTWMSETFGSDELQAYLHKPAFAQGRPWTDAAEQLEASFGVDLETLDARWRTEAPGSFRLGTSCGPADHHTLSDVLEIRGRLDCADVDTEGPSEDLEQTVFDIWSRASCLDVVEPTRARISFEAEHGRVYVVGHNVDCPEGGYHELPAGESIELDLLACEWVFGPATSSMSPTDYTITVESLGPIE
jgi:hypothetical protein